jgi:hypothetical protein
LLSGLPYSPLTNAGTAIFVGPGAGLGTTGAELRDDEISTARLPWQKFFDLKAQKGLKLMGWKRAVFVDARNLLDLKNQTALFQTTGDITDEVAYASRVQAHRETLGAWYRQNNVNLNSLSQAGTGVRNEVDLYLLQQAECRFGNCDKAVQR